MTFDVYHSQGQQRECFPTIGIESGFFGAPSSSSSDSYGATKYGAPPYGAIDQAEYESTYNVVDFGARPWKSHGERPDGGCTPLYDADPDDSAAIQRAIDTAIVNGVSSVFIPRGVYNIGSPIRIHGVNNNNGDRALKIYSSFAVLRATKAIDAIVSMSNSTHVVLSGLILDGNGGRARNCFRMFDSTTPTNLIIGTHFRHARNANVHISSCEGAQFVSCQSFRAGTHGWVIVDSMAASFRGCQAISNGCDGFQVVSDEFQNSCTLSSCWSEKNGRHGFYLPSSDKQTAKGKLTRASTIRDAYLEGNEGDGIRISTHNTSVLECKVTGVEGNKGAAIRVTRVRNREKSFPEDEWFGTPILELGAEVAYAGCNIVGNRMNGAGAERYSYPLVKIYGYVDKTFWKFEAPSDGGPATPPPFSQPNDKLYVASEETDRILRETLNVVRGNMFGVNEGEVTEIRPDAVRGSEE